MGSMDRDGALRVLEGVADSVERFVESPVVARERAFERQLDHVLKELDFSDVELEPPVIPHAGRKPWDNGGPGKS